MYWYSTGHSRPKLTLNLGDGSGRKRSGLGLTLTGIGTNEGASTSTQCNTLNFSGCESIDASQPLEKQGYARNIGLKLDVLELFFSDGSMVP